MASSSTYSDPSLLPAIPFGRNNGGSTSTLLPAPLTVGSYAYNAPNRGIFMANAYVTLGQGAAANNNLISGFRNGIYAINNTHKDIECIGALNATYLKTNKLGPAGFGLFCAAGATMPD